MSVAKERIKIKNIKKNKVGCYDCGLPYSDDVWIEAIIPDKVWNIIRPEGAGKGCGLLCISCISRRLVKKGLKDIPVWLCGTEPLKAMPGYPDEEPNIFILRNWAPKKRR